MLDSNNSAIKELPISVLEEIAMYTVQKINNYPKHLGKTEENYFGKHFVRVIEAREVAELRNNNGGGNWSNTFDCNTASIVTAPCFYPVLFCCLLDIPRLMDFNKFAGRFFAAGANM